MPQLTRLRSLQLSIAQSLRSFTCSLFLKLEALVGLPHLSNLMAAGNRLTSADQLAPLRELPSLISLDLAQVSPPLPLVSLRPFAPPTPPSRPCAHGLYRPQPSDDVRRARASSLSPPLCADVVRDDAAGAVGAG